MATKDGSVATVAALPNCDFCGGTAKYDGKTVHGPWAFMCQTDFDQYGTGLGTGRGQELKIESEQA